LSEKHLTVADGRRGRVWANHLTTFEPGGLRHSARKIAMSPLPSLLADFSDPLGLHLLDEHQKRYERIKAWREAQQDRYFDEVPVGWHEEFRDKCKSGGHTPAGA